MLVLTVLLAFAFIGKSATINLTYIVKKGQNELHPSCVAEENVRYAGVGWVYPLSKIHEMPNITTRFIPTIDNNFNCKFSKNAKCNQIWSIKNWQIDESSTRNFDLILDERWEYFPTIITNDTFKERVEIPNIFRLGFSVRAANVELFVCEGWNPHNYPCYQLIIGETDISLRKFTSVPKIASQELPLDSYKAYSNILSDEEWRNFVLSLDENGILQLIDVNVNRTVIHFNDKQPLKPLYLLVKSRNSGLWKIHQNQFIYTKIPQISRLGPILSLESKDLCVSLYVSTCANCAMTFIIMKNNERKVLEQVQPTKEFEWKLVKLKEENILTDKINIFVETKFVDLTLNQTEGFWAIDDVRVCHENEVKVTFLKIKNINYDIVDNISCQVIEHPKWRPKKLEYDKLEEFPLINSSATSDSISLSWTQEDPSNQINYLITYKANDICKTEPFNLRRIKSNGFLMTKHNEITIENLIPYTNYNITFSSMLHEKERELLINTLQSDLPTPEELPNKVQIQVTDNVAYVSWEKINCQSTYGHIIYLLNLKNLQTNQSIELKKQTDNAIEIGDLEPFTKYSLTILTARNFRDLKETKLEMSINFTTKAGVAPSIRNLELYSADLNSVSLRYDLPEKTKGVPIYLQVTRCNPVLLKKCKSSVLPIAKCALWSRKYCVDIDNLLSQQSHIFKLSIKNDYTNTFGEEAKIEGFTDERVPGMPTNITYRIVDCQKYLDYCHLNLTWLHPYHQNATINAFNIVLNSTNNNVSENIQEVLKIENKAYSGRYSYQIKYIPYSTFYDLYIQSANRKYRSNFTSVQVKTANIGDHIDQSPKLLGKTDTSLIFKACPVDSRLKSYKLTVVIQDYAKNVSVDSSILNNRKVNSHLCHNFGNTWISHNLEVTNDTNNVTIGTNESPNRYLEPNTQYCITFIVTNKYKNSEHDVVYYEKLKTPLKNNETENPTSSQYSHLYVLLFLLLLIPVGFFLMKYILKKRRNKPKTKESTDNVYESMPFEVCDENCVSNETYDELFHK